MSLEEKHAMIDANHPKLSIRKQCKLLGLNRSNLYYVRQKEPQENIYLMRLLDEEYTRHPFKGVRRMAVYLGEYGHC